MGIFLQVYNSSFVELLNHHNNRHMQQKITLSSLTIVFCLLMFYSCNNNGPKHDNTAQSSDTSAAVGSIDPVPLPDPGIPGFKFPEDSPTVNTWIHSGDMTKIYNHSWGIWKAMTDLSGEKYNGDDLRVYETWNTPAEIAKAIKSSEANKKMLMSREHFARGRSDLQKPRQFEHGPGMHTKSMHAAPAANDNSENLWVTVNYDPTAADYTITNKIYDANVLQGYLNAGNAMIPQFPNTSIAIKPTYKVITSNSLTNGYFELKVWTGPTDKDVGFPESDWDATVYIDPNNHGKGNGSVDKGHKGRTPETTYNVTDFISFKLDSPGVLSFDKQNPGNPAKVGDVAILVCMHMTTKEIQRWTWASYYWAPNPDKPFAPSSDDIAAARPSQLKGAPRHYGMTVAYTFISPDQPYTGGSKVGTSILTFNPYLEAGFDQSVLSPPVAFVNTNGKRVVNNVGVKTNCMSCHAMASVIPTDSNKNTNALNYIGDTYIDMGSKNTFPPKYIQLDFLWSIQGNMIGQAKSK
jgi:hypothetical protein